MHSVFNSDKNDISTRPIVIIRRTFNPIIELFRRREITYELNVRYDSEDEAVYKRVDEILRETGNYRFLQG